MVSPIVGLVLLLLVGLLLVRLRSGSRSDPSALKELVIGGGSARLKVPEYLSSRVEQDGTVLVYPAGDECISLRFSVVTGVPSNPGEDRCLEVVRREAEETGGEFSVRGAGGITYRQTRSEERGSRLVMHHWSIAEKGAITLISATILEEKAHDPRVAQVMAAMSGILDSLVVTYEVSIKRVATPTGPVNIKRTVLEDTPQTIKEFGPEERTWLESSLLAARVLVARHAGSEFNDPFDPRSLDRAFTNWLSAGEGRAPEEQVADSLGAAFGQHCVDALGARWVVVSDEHGIAYAVRHESGESMAFPVVSVQKRVASGACNFLVPIYDGFRDAISKAQRQKDASRPEKA